MKKLYWNGVVLTMEPGPAPSAVLTENGRILAAGTPESLAPLSAGAVRVDLAGRTLMPAFVDAHSHFSQVASSFLQISLDGVRTTGEIAARVAAFLRRTPSAGFLLARDYDPSSGAPALSRAVLDALCPDRPLLVSHRSGHMGWCNSAALRALGISEAEEDPAGGKYGREAGRLTGYMEENAYFSAMKKTPTADPAALLAAYRQAQAYYASFGIATVQEGMLVREMLPLYALLPELLTLDLIAYADLGALDAALDAFPALTRRSGGKISLGGVKIFLDGSPQGRTAWMREPYLGGTDCGYGTMTDEAVLDAMLRAARLGLPLLAHCNGDAACAQYLRCMAACQAKIPAARENRNVMIHAQFLGLDQLEEVARLAVIPSFFVAHVLHWGDAHLRNLGPARASKLSPAASALARGIPFTFHQDAPVIPPDMLETVSCAVLRRTRDGAVLGPEERIPVREALKAVTVNAARQYFEEDRKGSIRPGKQADFVILDRNPEAVPPEALASIRVLETIRSGETIYTADFA